MMINYRLKDSVVTHFPTIFKGLGSKPSVIHMALDVELHGGVLAVRVAGCRPIDCGKCSRSTVVDLARELLRRRHRVVLVEEACGFGYSFHRQLREIGVEAFVVATESLSGKRKTNRRDANKLHAHDPWLVGMLEHHQRLLGAQQQRIAELDWEIAQESNSDGGKVAKGLGQITFDSLQREAMDWKRFGNRRQIGSYIGCCPSEFSTGARQKLGSIDRLGNRRMRTLLVEAVWRLKKWNPAWRGFRKFPHVFGCQASVRGATRKKAVVACARLLAIDLWRLQTGRATLKDLGLKPAQAR